MNRYVILCGCGMPQRRPVPRQPVDGRQVVALIDDGRPDRLLWVEQNPPEKFSSTEVEPNRRGDRRSPFNLRCAGCEKGPGPIRSSTVAAVLDSIVEHHDQLIDEIVKLGWTIAINFHEEDVPATQSDDELWSAQFVTTWMFRQPYDGPTPKWVPRYSRRWVIPWSVFNTALTNLPEGRR
jgi:hypothetical protein